MIIHNPILTGSFTVNGTDVSSITSSAASLTSLNAYTASQNNRNGTYATTGSNTFAGIQTVNSNLVVTGSITAQTLVVQTVTSSVVYSSGSNVFGNNIANTQVFTGSMNLTGSLTVVTTGTEFQVNANGVKIGNVIGDAHSITGSVGISGSLTGVGATFNGEVSVPNGLFSINGNAVSGPPTGGVGIRHVNNRLLIYGGTTDITFQKNSNTGPNLTILESGAATFTNTITANTSITVNNSGAQAAILSAVSAFADGYRATLRLWNQHTGGKAWEVYSTNNSDGAYSGGKMVFVNSTDSVTTMTLTSGGSVGIGTSSPSSTFHVRGTFGAPSTTGSSLNGVARFGQTSGNGGLDIGFGDPYSWLQSRNATDYSVNYNLSLNPNGGRVGVGTISPSQNFAVVGAIKSSVSTTDGAAIAVAYGRTLYKILVSSNYDGGNAVRAGEWNVLTNNEGTGITNTTQIYNYNSQSATFSVSGGNIIISGLSGGNNQAAVFTN
jgi:hypothetical protein